MACKQELGMPWDHYQMQVFYRKGFESTKKAEELRDGRMGILKATIRIYWNTSLRKKFENRAEEYEDEIMSSSKDC